MNAQKFYITTPIYYVNAAPHIGHAYTTIAADVWARFHRLCGDETFFLTGTDEHGMKIQKKANEVGKDPQQFVDEIANQFITLWKKLDIQYDHFIRTTHPDHIQAVQQVLQELYDKGAIYKGTYKGLYCIGCEQFKNETDLVSGKCPDHHTTPELLEEESYLMKMEALQPQLIIAIESDQLKIAPQKYKNEILSFLKGQTLKDISISRKNVSWGIPLPFDAGHTTYVWVDAFLNYLTGLGWNGDTKNIPHFWPADIQLIGKDILRVHATIWPVILLHLGVPLQQVLLTHGHILSGGKKMSKTVGNVILIDEMLKKFGTDGTRYLLLSMGVFGEDMDMTWERMIEKYNADLANGLGNLVSRVTKLSQKVEGEWGNWNTHIDWNVYRPSFAQGKLDSVLTSIWQEIKKNDKIMEEQKPWELAKSNPEQFEIVLRAIAADIAIIASLLQPFIPATSKKILSALSADRRQLSTPLFPRIKDEL